MNITGRQIQLDDKRSVFVGQSDENDGLTYIKFINHEGDETRIKISKDARNALVTLLSVDAVFERVTTGGKWMAVYGDADKGEGE
jgi:hypothetical protein